MTDFLPLAGKNKDMKRVLVGKLDQQQGLGAIYGGE